MEQNKLNTTNTTVDVYKKLKKLEDIVLNKDNLDQDINNHPGIISYLKENTDGSTWYGADVLITSQISEDAIDWKRVSFKIYFIFKTCKTYGVAIYNSFFNI